MSNSVQPHRQQPTRLRHSWDSPGKNTGVGRHCLLQCIKVESESEVTQSCPTLSDPMDCSPPGSSIHGICQARVLEWGAIAFSILGIYNYSNSSWASPSCPFIHEGHFFLGDNGSKIDIESSSLLSSANYIPSAQAVSPSPPSSSLNMNK